MSDRSTYQVHANVNVDYGDAALRVTLTTYDESGASLSHRTWRKHVRALSYDGMAWTAYAATQYLVKMMADVVGDGDWVSDAPDVPLF